eukprot:9480753-Pyramimonas_sp.AAC.3
MWGRVRSSGPSHQRRRICFGSLWVWAPGSFSEKFSNGPGVAPTFTFITHAGRDDEAVARAEPRALACQEACEVSHQEAVGVDIQTTWGISRRTRIYLMM